MERVTLEIEARTAGKSSAARNLRRVGKIPGVFYGNGREPEPIAVDAHVLRAALSGDGGRHAILDVRSPATGRVAPAILKDFQLDPVRDRLVHFDLLEIRMDRAIESAVAVVLTGEPEGVRMAGGVLEQNTHEVTVSALPASIPERIEADVSALGSGDALRLGDLAPPEGATILGDPDLVIASVTTATQLEVAEEEAAEEAEVLEEGGPTAEAPEGE